MAEVGDMPKEIPDFEPTDLDDDIDIENMEMDPISSTTSLIIPDDEEETSFGGREYEKEGAIPKSAKKIFSEREKNQDESGDEIKSLFPDADTSNFIHWYDEYGQLKVKLNRKGAKPYSLFKGGKLNDEIPDTIRKALGVDYETMLIKNNNLLSQLNEANEQNTELLNLLQGLEATTKVYPMEIKLYEQKEKEIRKFAEKQQVEKTEMKSLFDATVKQNIELKIQKEKLLNEMNVYKDEIDKYKKGKSNLTMLERGNERLQAEVDKFRELTRKSIIYNQEQIADMESKNEEILKNLPLRERVKAIFKKYGFTVFAVVSAVGVVIGVIVSNLSKGLAKLGKGVGNGLKAIGKKLGEILPGMVGAIVSFLFKTAGEVIGFLGRNGWLLIMAVVLYFVERVKKSR